MFLRATTQILTLISFFVVKRPWGNLGKNQAICNLIKYEKVWQKNLKNFTLFSQLYGIFYITEFYCQNYKKAGISNMMKTLRSKLLLFFMTITFFSLFVIAFVSYNSQKEAMETQLERSFQLYAQGLITSVHNIIDEVSRDVGYLSANP
jgi:predicted neutral ceramidase superfamily lipid hydrolase